MNKYALRQSALTLTISSLLAGGAANAATITVTTAADGPIGSVPGCSLREAIASANDGNSQGGCEAGSPVADTIEFDSSLAQSTVTLNEGELEISGPLTINGPVAGDAGGLVIDGDNLSRIFNILGPSQIAPISFNLDSMTLTRARITAQSALGGAVRGQFANLDFQNVDLINNSASANAVGLYANAVAAGAGATVVYGSLTLTDCVLTGNETEASTNGDNSLSRALGSAVTVQEGGLSISGSRFSDNSATATVDGLNGSSVSSGAIVGFYANVTVVGSLIDNNEAQSYVTVASNEGNSLAGGIYVGDSDLLIVQTTISNNRLTAPDMAAGGGLIVARSDAVVRNSTLSGNLTEGSSGYGGGAAYIRGNEDAGGTDHDPASLVLVHSTLAFNSAAYGTDGIHAFNNTQSTVYLINSLVAQNDVGEIACNASVKYASSIATDTSCTGTATDLGDIKLSGLSDNGGATPTHGLLPGSVAIDAISECEAKITMDQRGQPRPGTGSSNCDIGAFEVQDDDDLDAIFTDRFEL